MRAIELMMEEHNNIKRVLKVIRKLCFKILNKEAIDYNIFYKIIEFVRKYADNHHHSKEEKILFKKMSEELDDMIRQGPIMAMLTEHHQGRYYMDNLERAVKEVQAGKEESKLDIIANAIGYANLLNAHIDKENNVLYLLGERQLSKQTKEEIDKLCEEVENEAAQNNIQDKYLIIVQGLENSINA